MPDEISNNEAGEERRRADEVFCELGRFVVKFEHVVFAMANTITFILQKNGLKSQQLAHIMLAELTADPIKGMLQAILGQSVQLEDAEKKIVKEIFKRVQALIERRNLIVHSFTVVGAGQAASDSIADSFKLSRGSAGSSTKEHQGSAAKFRELCDECTAVEQLVHGILLAMMSGQKFSDLFALSGKVVARKASC